MTTHNVSAADKKLARQKAHDRKKAERIRERAAHDLPKSMRPSKPIVVLTWIILVFAFIYFLFPIYWAIIASTKTPSELVSTNGLWFSVGPGQIAQAVAKNYSTLLGWTQNRFWQWVLNSLIYSGVSAAVGTIVAVMAGYATAKFDFRGKNLAIAVVMGCMLMPAALLTIPQYSIFHSLHLTNTMLSVIIPCSVSPFGFFLGRVYAQNSVPNELLEAARIDGAGEARIFFTMVLRLLSPAMVTIFLFLFVAAWNNFLLPLMMLTDESLHPVTLGLYGMASLATFNDKGALMMGALLGVLPLIVLFLGLQRYWQSGLSAGSVKE
ncbi:carbohydrate ABC transporter permease [Alloscardovia theropitheci]|uniref:Carbohydrate ABC transporter permease n=1 Tax=Alloscardovia theropitheci TaxID=2496842 RepID=A0A4R0QV22_9BIFI|nr:carbohydrate ABC transporter permease [Alloscardovia theropitheci]TCD53957.1 carbohydrate ABC transporter permease [Alloscardovia theropitheci]